MAKTSEGQEFEPIPVGTRVRLKDHPECTGKIYDHQWHHAGIYSALPYTVDWDNPEQAKELTQSFLPIWPTIEAIEVIP